MKSLRLRLVGLMLGAVAVIWIATAVVVWREAHHELHEFVAHLPAAVDAALEHDREEIIGEIAEHMAKPVLIAFPLLAILLLVAVSVALSPLRRLADEVGRRAPDHLDPIPLESAPAETRPLIGRLNGLFSGIGRALENERRLTADAAHELRTPLAALKAQAQVARAATSEAARDHALDQIIAGCDRASHLVEQLLMLARADAARSEGFGPVALGEVAAGVLSGVAEPAIAKGVELSLATTGGDVVVSGDALLLGVLLRNLVDNAIRHNPAGTRVEVSIGREPGRVMLVVRDDGPGIPSAERDAILQRFRRGSEASSAGSGLGLSIVQRIAGLHGARFELVSKPGAGGLESSKAGTAAQVIFPAPGASVTG